jgi:hypothetical protein
MTGDARLVANQAELCALLGSAPRLRLPDGAGPTVGIVGQALFFSDAGE